MRLRTKRTSRRQQNLAPIRQLFTAKHVCTSQWQKRVNLKLLHAINEYSLNASYCWWRKSIICNMFLVWYVHHLIVRTRGTTRKSNTRGNQRNRTTKRSSKALSSLAWTTDQRSSRAIGNCWIHSGPPLDNPMRHLHQSAGHTRPSFLTVSPISTVTAASLLCHVISSTGSRGTTRRPHALRNA
jgi:hypothetical protein